MAPVSNMDDHNFHHPFQPYEIQKQFMRALYDCIEEGKVGIFESPTGTGKSLSLICGSLTWLRDHKRRMFEEGLAAEVADDEPEWMLEYARKEKRQAALRRRADLEVRLARVREKEKKLKKRAKNAERGFKRQRISKDEGKEEEAEDQYVLDDYESDEEGDRKAKARSDFSFELSAETQALMKKLGMSLDPAKTEDDADEPDELKIFYCSRTHSQLTQFANELRRVKVPPAITDEHEETGVAAAEEGVKHLTLGSRKNLCINPKVNKLSSATAINERCLELQQSGTSDEQRCPYLPKQDAEPLFNDFRDHALAKIRDIEELGELGKELGVCPYYASRPAIKPSEIVTLPYPLLLQKSAREALNLSLKDHVVIIDEAHNLMDAISGIYSVSVSLAQLQRSRAQLGIYLQKFRNRLKGKNRVYVTQTVRLMDSLIHFLEAKAAEIGPKDGEGIVPTGDLMAGKGVDQINLYKLSRYLQESRLARKVDGYIVYADEQQQRQQQQLQKPNVTKPSPPKDTIPVLTHIQSFLLTLMNPSAEGRFFYNKSRDGDGSSSIALSYMLLDPANHFRSIVDDARAVILAGGTMSPMADYAHYLFPYLPPSRITTLSCGHVIPTSHLLALPLTHSVAGVEFDFTFSTRNQPRTIIELGQTLRHLLPVIPDGVVVFFPSYAYLERCLEVWKTTPVPGSNATTTTIYQALEAIKPLFHESSPSSTTTPSKPPSTLLSTYATAIATHQGGDGKGGGRGKGACLLAVIGGRLSEGINFSDALARAVLVVGLPFPNPHSAAWRAKSAHIASLARARSGASVSASTATASASGAGGTAGGGDVGAAAARAFYENATMRAVNQAVGRAIRHRGDWAAVVLVDRRYGTGRIRGKLPGWMGACVVRPGGVGGGEARGVLGGFYGERLGG